MVTVCIPSRRELEFCGASSNSLLFVRRTSLGGGKSRRGLWFNGVASLSGFDEGCTEWFSLTQIRILWRRMGLGESTQNEFPRKYANRSLGQSRVRINLGGALTKDWYIAGLGELALVVDLVEAERKTSLNWRRQMKVAWDETKDKCTGKDESETSCYCVWTIPHEPLFFSEVRLNYNDVVKRSSYLCWSERANQRGLDNSQRRDNQNKAAIWAPFCCNHERVCFMFRLPRWPKTQWWNFP